MIRTTRPCGRARKPAFVPRLTTLEDRTLLATLVVDPAGGTGVFTTIQAAVSAANPAGGDTIQIHPATYTEQVTIDKSLTMMSTAPGVIIQSPSTLTPDPVSGLNALVVVENGATVNMSDLTIQGPIPQAYTIDAGILVDGGATANVTNSTIAHIRGTPLNNISGGGFGIQVGGASGGAQVGTATITNDTITDYQKEGIRVNGGSSATITGNMIATAGPATDIAQNGILINTGATATITGNTITGNQYTGPGSGPNPITNTPGAGIIVLGSASVTGNTVTGNDWGIYNASAGTTISGNTVQGSFEGILLDQGTATVSNNTVDGNNIGVAVITYVGNTANSQGTIVGNNIVNNGNGGLSFPGAGISVLAESGATTTALATANFNRIVGNSVGLDNTTTAAVDATMNWWGSNTGPNTTGNDTTSGSGVNTSPWLVLSLSASPATIGPGGTSSVTASVTSDSSGATHSTAPFFPDGVPIAFSATGGTMTPASAPTQSGSASSNFTSTSPGTASVSVTLDNQTLSTPITIQPLSITQPAIPQEVMVGQPLGHSFAAAGGAGGFVYAISAGQLPPGLALDSRTGLVSGSPTTPGTYAFTVTATDLSAASVSQNSTIVVISAQVPAQVAAPVVESLRRFGFHAQPTTFVLTFSTALEPASAEDVANYRLNPISGHRLGPAIPIKMAVYDPTTDTVTLHFAHRVYLFHQYRLLVNGSTPTGVTGATGLLLDGKGNGQPGSDYVKIFGSSILAGPYRGFSATTIPRARHSHVDRAHPTTKDPRPVPRGPLATVRSGRIGATAGKTHVGLKSVPSRLGAR